MNYRHEHTGRHVLENDWLWLSWGGYPAAFHLSTGRLSIMWMARVRRNHP